MNAGRDLLDVVGDEDQRRRLHVGGELAEAAHEVLAASEVEAGGRLVEQHELRVGHERPGDLDPLALTLAKGAEAPVRQVVGPEGLEQLGPPARGRGCRRPRASGRRRRRRP